jgi:hypothetical protein
MRLFLNGSSDAVADSAADSDADGDSDHRWKRIVRRVMATLVSEEVESAPFHSGFRVRPTFITRHLT